MQKGQSEKVVKYRWWPRNSSDGRSLAKALITTIPVNLVPIPNETAWDEATQIDWNCHCYNFFTDLLSQSFLGRPCISLPWLFA